GIFSVNEEGRFTFANNTMLELLEIPSHHLLYKRTLHEFLAAPPRHSAPYSCFPGNDMHQQGILIFRSATGKEFKANVTHSLTKTSDNHMISRSIVHDLTAEQNMQRALKESEDKFQRLFEEAPVGICLVDRNTCVI